MARLADLPPEIFHQIISDIAPSQQKTLSSLSLSCQKLNRRVTPYLYHTLHLRFSGRPSWKTRTEILECLAPPSTYKLPTYVGPAGDAPVDRKGKGVAGRPRATGGKLSSASSPTLAQVDSEKQPQSIKYIREIVIDGYWLNVKEQSSDEYWHSHDGDMREHQPFLDALEGLLWSMSRLEQFSWKIAKFMPPRLNLAIARFETLKSITICGDTHMYCSRANIPSYNDHAPLTNDPVMYGNNSLETLRALQTGDLSQVIHYGDVIRSPTNWKSLRHFELDVSSGFISTNMELEPLEPDLLAALFRPPPPGPGEMFPAKLQLKSFKLRDIPFQHKGINAVKASVDPGELKELDFYYCQDGMDLLKNWTKNKLKKLERLHIKEELSLTPLCKFLKQFGPEGTCRELKTLELCCWHVDRWSVYDPVYTGGIIPYTGPGSHLYHYDDSTGDSDDDDPYGDGDLGYEDMDIDEEESDSVMSDSQEIIVPPIASSRPRFPLPQPWRRIKELRGNEAEGWGLERLILDMRPGMSSITARQLPRQELFVEGFWCLRELAIPLSYEPERWKQFIDTVAKLPSLEAVFLLNARTEPRSGSNYVSWSPFQPPFTGPAGGYPPLMSQFTNARSRTNKRKAKDIVLQDQLYTDALALAAANRLHVHSVSSTRASSSALPSSAWRGKLQYIGIRSSCPVGLRPMARVWKIEVNPIDEKPVELAPDEASAERRKSLRSSTRKRKVEPPKDWRTIEEGGMKCSLEEIWADSKKCAIAGGLFKGMVRDDFNFMQI
ncbi:hypothetical protein EDC01DRAFT_638558 [Geopyxis carbonaria]|nr:hypothetical protein EDC01DRAFT_638558 [Geopyxis carbonaria]